MLASLLGVRMTLWIGPVVAVPAPVPLVEALQSVEVTLNSEGRDGFQLTFSVGRGTTDIVDYPLVANPLLRPFNRVIVQVWLGPVPEVLIDGFITCHQITPSNDPGASTLTVTGEDLRVMMDLHEISIPYPQMSPEARVALILLKYMAFLGGPPMIIPQTIPDVPIITDRIPVQSSTDLAYVQRLANDAGYVFYVDPTPVPMVNIAYWGPENRLSLPQSALTINAGPDTNVSSLQFSYDALEPKIVLGLMQEKRTRAILPVVAPISTNPPLALMPAGVVQQPNVRSVLPRDTGGLDPMQANARAQAQVNRASDVLTAEGELDAMRYGRLLKARRSVGVRGAGFMLDGFYFVKRVTHTIKRGEYKQRFVLSREGFGALSPVVVP